MVLHEDEVSVEPEENAVMSRAEQRLLVVRERRRQARLAQRTERRVDGLSRVEREPEAPELKPRPPNAPRPTRSTLVPRLHLKQNRPCQCVVDFDGSARGLPLSPRQFYRGRRVRSGSHQGTGRSRELKLAQSLPPALAEGVWYSETVWARKHARHRCTSLLSFPVSHICVHAHTYLHM